jgi:hypothetical protein
VKGKEVFYRLTFFNFDGHPVVIDLPANCDSKGGQSKECNTADRGSRSYHHLVGDSPWSHDQGRKTGFWCLKEGLAVRTMEQYARACGLQAISDRGATFYLVATLELIFDSFQQIEASPASLRGEP